jgi:hypothetical protein
MSTDILGQEDLDLNTCHISKVREEAKKLGVTLQRDWKRADIIKAIKIANGELVPNASALDVTQSETIVDEEEIQKLLAAYTPANKSNSTAKPLKPGFARIIIHKDPTPGHSNSAVPLGLNGQFRIAPRGVEFDIEKEFVGVLAAAIQTVTRQKNEPTAANPAGEVVEEEIPSYPFQVLAITPGEAFRSDIDQRSSMAARRHRAMLALKKWPTLGELMEWEKEQRLTLRS